MKRLPAGPIWFLVLLGALLGACGGAEEAGPKAQQLESAVMVSTPAALAWTKQLLAETDVAVWRFHELGVHTGETVPSREALTQARRARLVVLHGAGFEQWAQQSALPTSRTIRLADACKEDWIEVEARTHAHGGQGAHTHRGVEPHTWLHPAMVLKQYRFLAQTLKESFPVHADSIAAAQAIFERRLQGWVTIPIPAGSHVIEHGKGFVYLVQDEEAQAKAVELPEDLMRSLLDPKVELSAGMVNRVRSKIGSAGSLLVVEQPLEESREAELRDRLGLIDLIFQPLVEHADDTGAQWFAVYERDMSGREWSNSFLQDYREQE